MNNTHTTAGLTWTQVAGVSRIDLPPFVAIAQPDPDGGFRFAVFQGKHALAVGRRTTRGTAEATALAALETILGAKRAVVEAAQGTSPVSPAAGATVSPAHGRMLRLAARAILVALGVMMLGAMLAQFLAV